MPCFNQIAAAHRDVYAAPVDVEAPLWCSMCNHRLAGDRHGWMCVDCGAAWDLRGLHGQWLTEPASQAASVSAPRPAPVGT